MGEGSEAAGFREHGWAHLFPVDRGGICAVHDSGKRGDLRFVARRCPPMYQVNSKCPMATLLECSARDWMESHPSAYTVEVLVTLCSSRSVRTHAGEQSFMT